MANLEVVIRYEGEGADAGLIDLYDASESLAGIAKAVNFVAHAFANNNEVRDKIPRPTNFKTYMGGARKGCFENVIDINFSPPVVAKIGGSVINKHFWEYLSATLNTAVGQDFETDNPYVSKILNSNDSPFEELAFRLETPLQEILRPINRKGAKIVSFVRPHVGEIVTMDKDTYNYVSTRDIDVDLSHWTGNVTKYNILTGYGRAYIDSLRRTVPFNIDRFAENQIAHRAATASMDERARIPGGGKRRFVGHKVINATQTVKRIVVTEINQQE
jgi:hypothetical protein